MIYEIEPTSLRDEDVNRQIRHDANRRNVVGITPNSTVTEEKKKDNSYFFQDGEHGGMSLSKPNTSIMGMPGSQIIKPVVFSESARLTNIHFKDSVSVSSATATVIFVCCRVELAESLSLESGAKAIFIGCLFEGDLSGNVIDNPGAVTDVQLVGCSNKTGQALGNVTSVAVTS